MKQMELDFIAAQAEIPSTEKLLETLTDDELKARLATALRLGSVGVYYNIRVDTPEGPKYILDRNRVIPFLKDPKKAEAEVDRRYQESLQERTSGPGGID